MSALKLLFVHTIPKWVLRFLFCIYIAYQYAVFAKLKTKGKK